MAELSIILFEDSEKPERYLRDYMESIKRWNREGLDQSQMILVTQKKSTATAEAACKSAGVEAEIVKSDCEYVGGSPVWDVMADLRKAWPRVKGNWITINHTEFIWCRDRLVRTIDWLKRSRYYLNLGNLRRPAMDQEKRLIGRKVVAVRPKWRPGNCDRGISDGLSILMERKKWDQAAEVADRMPTVMWPLWKAPIYQFGRCRWTEDVFFADRRWMENWKALDHGGELPFQDIFDLMGAAYGRMQAKKIEPRIFRMEEKDNRIIHLWHKKNYLSFTEEIRDWFLKDPERWKGTQFMNPGLWDRLFKFRNEADRSDAYAKYDLRRGPGGTLTRYEEAMKIYLQNGGTAKLMEFYRKHGRLRREREYA
jgi:hypothetical protein